MSRFENPGICGIGAVTGYGTGCAPLWDGLLAGKPAARLEHGYGHGRDEAAWVARVPGSSLPRTTSGVREPSRFGAAFHAAATEAITDALRRGWQPGRTVGLIHAAVLGEVDRWADFHIAGQKWRKRDYLDLMPSTPVSNLMKEYGFHGPSMTVCAMCASGVAALLTAKTWIDTGIVDDVVIVAADLSATPANVAHFRDLGVAITDTEPLDACRPFQNGSRGFILGEAAAGLVVSRRSRMSYSYVLGGAMNHDAHHPISVEPTLTHVMRCFGDALDNAGVSAEEIRYHYAHGPGTPQCDDAEIAVLERFFPSNTQIFSTKQLTGHCQGAAAALELAIHCLCHEHGIVPAPPAVGIGHPRLLAEHRKVESGLTIKSALGMGGHNAAVVLSPPCGG